VNPPIVSSGASAPPAVDEPVLLTDGRRLRVRPLLPADEPAYRRFVAAVSPRSQYYRFFSPRPSLTEREIDRFLHDDHVSRLALVAEDEATGDLVAVARYDRTGDPAAAEVAFVVRDDHQGRGLGPQLLHHLAAAARPNGIERFEAAVLPDNQPMLKVFARSGWLARRRLEDGAVVVTLDLPA
jgi:RimJ/RimL family protein N-acetyltransferase